MERFSFKLRGTKGTEIVKICMSGIDQTFQLTKGWNLFIYPVPKTRTFSVHFTNDQRASDVIMTSADKFDVRHGRFEEWKCGSTNEGEECEAVRKGVLAWGGGYYFNIKQRGKQSYSRVASDRHPLRAAKLPVL